MTADIKVRDAFLEANGLQLHYREWGDAAAAPLVLLHGVTGNAHAWDGFAAAMADRFRVLALGQRGHGDSDWADGYATEEMAEDVGAFADALGLGRFALLGHSMGGINAYTYAGRLRRWSKLLTKIGCPTLVVRGAESDALEVSTAKRMADVIPNAGWIAVPEAGHGIPADNPGGFLDAVRPFLLADR